MSIFRTPPEDYDGSNKKLVTYLGVSERQVERLLKGLEADGLIRISLERRWNRGQGYWTYRTIFLVKEK